MKVLVVDIGNSRIKWRVSGRADGLAAAHGDIDGLAASWDEPLDGVDAALVSNVAGDAIESRVIDAIRHRRPALPVERLRARALECDVENGYGDPSRLGPDRWAALIGAHARAPDRHLLVCGFGTATTIDLLLASRAGSPARFVGGLILPGVDAMRGSLHRSTARLPVADGQARDFATDTDDAIESGIVTAQLGAVARAAANARARLSPDDARELGIVFSGGWAAALAALDGERDETTDIVPGLVLDGLEAIATVRFRGF